MSEYNAPTKKHRVGEVLDYGFDYEDELHNDSDIITSSSWAFTGNDTALGLGSDTFTTFITKVWISGGTLSEKYKVENTIVTSAGRTFVRSFYITIADE